MKTEIFYAEEHFNHNAGSLVPAYWGYYNDSGILQCHDSEEEAREAAREDGLDV
jgi:hypothetical protein